MPFENFSAQNPLGYLGINPDKNPGIIEADRAPTTADQSEIGTIWVDKPNDAAYVLTSVVANSANWELAGSPTAAVSSLASDSGSASPAAGIITIAGGTGLDSSASGSTLTLAVNESLVNVATVSLTSAEVKALAATQITLVAAPGAGKMIQFESASFKLVYGGTNAFTEAGDNLSIKYTDDSGVAVSQTIETTGFIDQTASTYTNAQPVIDAIVAASAAENAPLVLDNLGSEIAGNAANDNTLEVSVSYRVVEI